ncbi:MAG: hypothetical protein EZS28_029965 [Streblomastix strix]|uniref:Uncharacterized protein n=1 Tax=Streblomastix strix TaxID=222440 RepID=A0A5J4UVM2_9EUKA|nr:MAG: hypothetical protein EZS28_029965 [Streblomastix strix]
MGSIKSKTHIQCVPKLIQIGNKIFGPNKLALAKRLNCSSWPFPCWLCSFERTDRDFSGMPCKSETSE